MPASLGSSCHVGKANSPSLQGTLPSMQGQLGELDPIAPQGWSLVYPEAEGQPGRGGKDH